MEISLIALNYPEVCVCTGMLCVSWQGCVPAAIELSSKRDPN